jgi:MFS family permease
VTSATGAGTVETAVPARMDRLPWSRWHWLVLAGLGTVWILDGLEVTIVGALAERLTEPDSGLALTETEVGAAASAYVAGAVLGALLFGYLTDRLGRKKLFLLTLGLYLAATVATAFSFDAWFFLLMRFLTGAGIGGEYTAINSTIQELIPARVRGWSDLVINGTFWIGAAIGAFGSVILLDSPYLTSDMGWRAAFLIGAALGLVILFMRVWIPESPRWLMTHGRPAEAEAIVAGIERRFLAEGATLPPVTQPPVHLRMRGSTPLREVFHTLFDTYRSRALVGLALMVAQAFFYNAIFFTFALILTDFYGIRAADVGWYMLPFAAGNFLGPLILGRLFDTVGRRPMIAFTYAISAILLVITGYLFQQNLLTARTLTIAWMVVFFFASVAASSAYLTVSETFPLEIRALAIAVFYAVGTGLGGIVGPVIFGVLIETGSRTVIYGGYLVGSALMLAAAVIGGRYAVAAEGKSLEAVARPLASAD